MARTLSAVLCGSRWLAAEFELSEPRRMKMCLVLVYGQNECADAGGVMAYSFSVIEQYRSGATFMDKILKGANPAGSPSSSRRTSSWYSISRRRKLNAARTD